MDPISAAVGSAVAKAGDGMAQTSGRLLERLVGPLFDEMGSDLVERYKSRNAQRLIERTAAKAANKDGYLNLRSAARGFEATQYSDDALIVEYVSAVLASSKSFDGRDDRATPWIALIDRLSSLQLRLHYVLYRSMRSILLGWQFEHFNQLQDQRFLFPWQGMGLGPGAFE
jgi:hypothetical protein